MKKIGICADGKDMQSKVKYGIGSSQYVCIAEWDNNKLTNYRFLTTTDKAALMQELNSEGIESLITGTIGPGAYNHLTSQGINIYNGKSLEIADAVNEYFAGNLIPLTSPNNKQKSCTGKRNKSRGGSGCGQGNNTGQGYCGQGTRQGYRQGQGQGNCGGGNKKGCGHGRNKP